MVLILTNCLISIINHRGTAGPKRLPEAHQKHCQHEKLKHTAGENKSLTGEQNIKQSPNSKPCTAFLNNALPFQINSGTA